jgi:hypothetical protein
MQGEKIYDLFVTQKAQNMRMAIARLMVTYGYLKGIKRSGSFCMVN